MPKKDALKIIIQNGEFKSGKDVLTERNFKITPTEIVKDGWRCCILEDKTLECIFEEKHSYGNHSLVYVVDSQGNAKLILKIPRKRVKILSESNVFIRESNLTNGILFLTKDWELHEKKAFFIET